MTIDECKKYLPNRWAEIIQQDPLLMEIFKEHDYDLEEEAVPPFLFQELRGGNIEHMRPIFALYGQTGLNMLQELLEIDEISKDTSVVALGFLVPAEKLIKEMFGMKSATPVGTLGAAAGGAEEQTP